MAIGASEAETFWTEFLRSLARRGLARREAGDLRRPQGPEGRRDAGSSAPHGMSLPRALRPHTCWPMNTAARAVRVGSAAFVATAFAQEDADSAKVQWRQVADQL